jgi:hypothetical protein
MLDSGVVYNDRVGISMGKWGNGEATNKPDKGDATLNKR